MSADDTPKLENEITVTTIDRRSFVRRAVGVGALASGVLLTTTACPEKGDNCDRDTTDLGPSADPFDFGGDPCDSD